MCAETVDITHPIRCTISGWKAIGSHTEYVIEIERQLGDKEKWKVQRRYAQFYELNKQLEKFGIDLRLPPKKVIGNRNEDFISKRRAALQNFLDIVCSHSLFYGSAAFTNFLEVLPDRHAQIYEWVFLSLRGKPSWSLQQHIVNCGWRSAKEFYEVRCGKKSFLLSGIRYGPYRYGTAEQINEALDFIRSLQYPHVNESIVSWADHGGIISVRPIFNDGTLRDHLYKSIWREEFLLKYSVDRSVCSLETIDTRFICRQVLEALSLLCTLSIPYLDVHSGNVMISDCGCEIIDVDQVLAGQPNFHRPSMLKCSAINSIEDMMVFSFGEFLFELLSGYFSFPMNAFEDGLSMTPPIFQPLIRSIFSPEVRKMPTLYELISSDLFADIPVAKMNRREIRMPAGTKKLLDGLCFEICSQFQADRSQLNRMHKEQKIRQLIFSEGERMRRKQIIKCEQMKLSQNGKAEQNFISTEEANAE